MIVLCLQRSIFEKLIRLIHVDVTVCTGSHSTVRLNMWYDIYFMDGV